ncbi:hypothetical protein SASPL_130270 [Salvia splendens]|uniref:Uncharacterized protein n=1 Tax=Salvia splendens TaxID=180675 RepID=A0A8X8X6Y0_SALSN|nr:hypothetical protein SASPL_130270 [Salvia splendens]
MEAAAMEADLNNSAVGSDPKPLVLECSSIFVEPMKWMEALEEGCVGDKLQCIGCKARLGSFNWAGINPAFQLHKSRLDECHY